LLESVGVVDARLLDEIVRTVVTPAARRLVLATAEEALRTSIATSRATAPALQQALTRVTREIEHLLRALETGDVPAVVLARLREREREQEALEAQLAAADVRTLTELDARRVRRVFDDGLARLGDVLQSDTAATRQALSQILAEKVCFTPIALPCGTRTYRFEATLALGRILGITRQNDEDVPEGVCTP